MKKGHKTEYKNIIVHYLSITLGTFLMAVAYKNIYDSVGMITGGFSGVSIIFRHMAGVPIWIINIILNIPLFISSYYIMGLKFIKKTIYGTVTLIVFLAILPEISLNMHDYLLAAVFGGAICGTGIGIVLKNGTTTGGTDMLATLIHQYVKNVSLTIIIQILDGIVVMSGAVIFGIDVSLYAIIAIYITQRVSDLIIEGSRTAKEVMIISDRYEQIARDIMSQAGRGVTTFDGTGAYSGNKKTVLLCVVTKKQIPQIKQIAAKIDEKAFIVVGDVREVMGEGFVQYIH